MAYDKAKIEKALSEMLRVTTADVSEPVIRPAITMNGQFNIEYSSKILKSYWYEIINCETLEDFNKLINKIVGIMGFDLSNDVVEVAMICNALRLYKGLSAL